MPKLTSGRQIAVARPSLVEHVKLGTDVSIYAFIVAYRLEVQRPSDIRGLLPVMYFREDQGEPPHAPAYASDYLVKDVLSGNAGWAQEEVDEFRLWLEGNGALSEWLNLQFAELNEAIRQSPIWTSELVTDVPESGAAH